MEVPEGFAPAVFLRPVPFIELIGPTFLRYGEAGIDAGAWITEANRNGGQMAHGAFLLALADMATGRLATVTAGPGYSAVHISLGMEFFAPAPLGAWVEARARLDRKGTSIIFCGCDFYVGTEKIGRATAVLKTIRIKAGMLPEG